MINNVTVTQTKTIQEQLKSGIRMFDLRVAEDKDKQLRLAHGGFICGEKTLEEELKVIQQFQKEHNSEIVMLNIKLDDAPESAEEKASLLRRVSDLVRKAGMNLYAEEKVWEKKVSEIADRKGDGKCIVNINENKPASVQKETGIRWKGSKELWPNEDTAEKMQTKLKEQIQRTNGKTCYASYSLTPKPNRNFADILFSSDGLKKQADELHKAKEEFDGVFQESGGVDKLSGIMSDNVDEGFVQKVYELVKQEYNSTDGKN